MFKKGVKHPPRKPKSNIPTIPDEHIRAENFAGLFLGEELYECQKAPLKELNYVHERVVVRTPNGAGKTTKIIKSAVMWYGWRYPGSVIVCTSAVHRQVMKQLWPELRRTIAKQDPKGIHYKVTEGEILFPTVQIDGVNYRSQVLGFATTEPGKFEGFHKKGPPGKEMLLIVVDEAKSVPDLMFEAVERCQPTNLLVCSSPGPATGAFWRMYHRERDLWKTFVITPDMLPHIDKEWIAFQIEKWGENHPLVRSMIYAEFMDMGADKVVIPYSVYDACMENPPAWQPGKKVAFCDFAAGGDENVLAVVNGNKVIAVEPWVEKSTTSAIGEFILKFRKHELKQEDIYGDVGGGGFQMCDMLREAGWDIHRVNNGEAARNDDGYKNLGTEIWYTAKAKMEKKLIILPDDNVLRDQACNRFVKADSRGKIWMESKDDLRARGAGSPDRFDAVAGAIYFSRIDGVQRPVQYEYDEHEDETYPSMPCAGGGY